MSESLDLCLPADLRGSSTRIIRIAAGLSGAGVYRVDAGERAFVLKISPQAEPPGAWRHTVHIRQLAADAGVAPRVVHVDEERRAVLSDFVVDRSFPIFFSSPATRDAAFALLGQTLRRVHEIPLAPDAPSKDPREFLGYIWSGLARDSRIPGFVGDAVQRVLGEEPPPRERALVLSHNDVNPTNLIFDGERLLLLDWDTAGPNDPFYDLAAISVFLRMDGETSRRLLAIYDDRPVAANPSARFAYNQRLVATMCGAMLLHLASRGADVGASGDETLASAPSLGDVYRRFQAGELTPATSSGQWAFGLALMKESAAV